MTSHQDLLSQIAELQKQADQMKNSERKGAVDQVNSLIAEFDLRASDLRFAASGGSVKPRLTRKPVAAKYRDNAGNTWSGRGRTPNWLTAAEAAGKKRESFLI